MLRSLTRFSDQDLLPIEPHHRSRVAQVTGVGVVPTWGAAVGDRFVRGPVRGCFLPRRRRRPIAGRTGPG